MSDSMPPAKRRDAGLMCMPLGECWHSALSGGRLAHALKLDRIEEADRAELQAYAATLPKEDELAK